MKLILVLLSLISLGNCGENSVSINVKNVINTVSDKFISYEVKFHDLMSLFQQRKSLENLSLVSPAYVRLQEFSSYLKSKQFKKLNESDVALLFKSLNSFQITPVIVIEYTTTNFEPIKLLQDLKNARDLKINECVWQLGDNSVNLFDSLSLKKYADDLKTLKVLCESVKKEHHLNWDVAADSTLYKNHVEKLPFEVLGYDLMRVSPLDVVSKLNSWNYKSQAPTWITIDSTSRYSPETLRQKTNHSSSESCDQECVMSGLLHAQVLGDAAKKGFDVLFFHDSTNNSLTQSSSFVQAVSVLHKKLVGTKVFNVRVTKSSPESKLMNLYSYCSKKQNGAITLMGINFNKMRSKFNVKISSPIDSNSVVMQYLLSASDGQVRLNNEKFSYNATPSYKFKKLSKFSLSLVLPPFSMAFWTIKNAKFNECLNIDEAKGQVVITNPVISSSTDKLLKKLVANEFEGKRSNSIEKLSRPRRQLNGNQFLPKIDFDMPFKFPSLLTSSSNHKPIKDVLFNKNTEVYRVGPVDANPLQSSENPTLPDGDVYLLINDGNGAPGSIDYVTDDRDEPKRRKLNRKKSSGNKITYKERDTTEEPEDLMPHDYLDASQRNTKKTTKKSAKPAPPKEIGELFEAELPSNNKARSGDQMKTLSSNVELQTVFKELEPTYRQSKTAILAARRKWDREQIMELLRDAQLEEVDKAAINDADDFEVIDLTENAESPNYEEYEEDDDGFFDDNLHNIRTRRHIDYAKNEIPRYGSHNFIDEEYEDSIESLLDDVHLFLPPRNENQSESLVQVDSTTSTPSTTTLPIPVQAMNYLTKSLTDVIDLTHKTMLGWWGVFNPSDTYY